MTVETIEYKGFIVDVLKDSDPINPRIDFDNPSTLVCFHSSYDLGDQYHDYVKNEAHYSWGKLVEHLESQHDASNVLPVYLLDHSGLSISTTPFDCPWDSGQIGFIFTTNKTLKENGWTKQQAREQLIHDVKLYNEYLGGQVYGYNIEKLEESCYGYFGDDVEKSGLLNDVKKIIDAHLDIDWGSEWRISDITRKMVEITESEVNVTYCDGKYIVFGSELASLKLWRHYNKDGINDSTNCGEVNDEIFTKYFFSVEVLFEVDDSQKILKF